MTKTKPPSDIAREAFKLLAARKLSPTPINYQECYNEIANLPNVAGFPEARLRQIALVFTARNSDQQTQLDLMDVAIGQHNWQGVQEALRIFDKSCVIPRENGNANRSLSADSGTAASATPIIQELLLKVAHLIESMQPALGVDDSGISEQVAILLQNLRAPTTDIQLLLTELVSFTHRLSFAAEDQAAIKLSLLNLLHLVIENISKLTLDDSWLDGQINALLAAIQPPLNLRHLDEVEQRIRDVMYKQAAAKGRSLEAQAEMRQMLGAFIEYLTRMNDSSTSFQERLEDSTRKIEQVKSIEELAPLMRELVSATHAMAEETSTARNQLQFLQDKVTATEAEIAKLHLELQSASASARHDPLTNTLNRKGLDEALAREIANVQRKDIALSISLLDIDNFKKINDRLGHETGDAALIHLVRVVQQSLRPTDTLARYGGEEFIILLPDTPLDEAILAMTRLQRELTKNFFLSGTEKLLITFSAGVAQLAPGEPGEDAIKRADQAMYLAKRAGKNRVMGS